MNCNSVIISMPKKRRFTVAIYANEYRQICAWVLKNQTLETGGDLFGLWADDRTAVIQLVLGPGENCRRATHSFYQDVDYLEKIGSDLTGKEALCHIGEWHSHHTIGLTRPSGGDEGTVWRNMPNYGLNRFILFIANIGSRSPSEVSVGCFLFEFERGSNRKLPVLQGSFELMPDESPFRSIARCVSVLKKGAECINSDEEIACLQEVSTDAAKTDARRPVMRAEELSHGQRKKKRRCPCPWCTML